MLNRIISNLVLGFFVVVLVVVYGVAKQPSQNRIVPKQQLATGSGSENLSERVFDNDEHNYLQTVSDVKLVMPNGRVIDARVAETEADRQQGLSNTDPLPDGKGMLFVFPEPDVWGIWMKDMKYDLDIVWFDADGQIVHVVEGAKAPVGSVDTLTIYKDEIPALYVLEVPAGRAAEYGLSAGSQVKVS